MYRFVTSAEIDALRRMPVWFDEYGGLPEGSPDPKVIDQLMARAFIKLLPAGAPDRYALTYVGQRFLWPDPFQAREALVVRDD